MATISVRLSGEEELLLKKYVETKGTNVSQFIKEMIFEVIEDEYDREVLQDYLEREAKGTVKLVPFDEAVKEWDL